MNGIVCRPKHQRNHRLLFRRVCVYRFTLVDFFLSRVGKYLNSLVTEGGSVFPMTKKRQKYFKMLISVDRNYQWYNTVDRGFERASVE